MDECSYVNEVIEEIREKRTIISLQTDSDETDETAFIHCNSPNHTSNTRLREGNKVFAILLKTDSGWVIETTTCWQCSVRDSVERVTGDFPIAIVEGTLKKPSIREDNSEFHIKNPEVWEVINPAK